MLSSTIQTSPAPPVSAERGSVGVHQPVHHADVPPNMKRILTPSKVEAVISKITPTRLRQPPVRTPVSGKRSGPSPVLHSPPCNGKPSPLEDRPPWDPDFHVNRPDLRKPKPGRPISATSPGIARPVSHSEDGKSPSFRVSPYSKLPRATNDISGKDFSEQSSHSLLRSRSVDFRTATGQVSVMAELEELQKTCDIQKQRIALLEGELEVKTGQINDLERKVLSERKNRENMEADFAHREAEILQVWEKEFEQGRSMARELAMYKEFHTEAREELTGEVAGLKGELDRLKGIMNERHDETWGQKQGRIGKENEMEERTNSLRQRILEIERKLATQKLGQSSVVAEKS
ncbi:uncharacterized protein SPPG_05525 [Spizellomyces punctatus DAOM BR117]|uniref:Transforming acidic coiled-coil-containing protein C-terminal domain-containing protein n=1 Tax=Spizellomyces punctatus (strain DAOM BR117) TaxID=645134 RepID=A0A0L0HCK7_SPIPD|nr:uncharacterized protein SPPG_05525 [Spizellomyces punctatus DAOM BR117]KNC99270.1 hypothetical protein SPPG_05525 [Spizellomyces punctatus DAOM BR117]|eukprot:XP_016607310.1 hypothetical protein SPPG_05525 [Spizellomyces punctatus DAOM BR117]